MSEKTNQTLMQRAFSGMVWKLFEKVGFQAIQLIIQIVLARLLMPEEYGLVGLLSIFIAVADVFILQGLTTALIQKKEADNLDFSSVFFANLVLSTGLYLLLFFAAPWIAMFYNEPALCSIMRVLSLNVVIGAIPAVHNAILSRELDFKKSFIRNISNVLTQGVVGVLLAYLSFGAWALVYSKIAGTLVGAVILCLTVKWKPERVFSIQRVKGLFSYSSKVLMTNLLNTVFNNIHSLIIGRYYTAADLGHYQRGQQLPQTMMVAVDGSMSEVLYPTFSQLQHDLTALKNAMRRSIRLSMFVVLPLLLGLLAVAEPLTIVLLTEKWLPSVPFMRLACIVCMFWPLAHRTHALNALGLSQVTLKLSLIGKSVTLIAIFVCLRWGIYAIMLGTICSSAICLWITSWYVKKHIGYTLGELAKDVLPPLALSLVMVAVVMLIGNIALPVIAQLFLQVITGMVVYAGGAKLLHFDSMEYLLGIIKKV